MPCSRFLGAATLSFFAIVTTVGCSPPGMGDRLVGSENSLKDDFEDTDSDDSGPLKITKTTQADGTVLASAGEYEVVIDKKDRSVPDTTIDGLLEVHFGVYGKMSERFNKAVPKRLRFVFDPDEVKNPAHAAKAGITFSAKYVKEHPKDLDVVTHEGFHVVQNIFDHYTQAGCPAWVVEGAADYARYRYGLKNAKADWSLGDFEASQKWTDAYRTTARFFVWVENHVRSSIMDDLQPVLQRGEYSDAFWTEKTGKSLDQLWSEYGRNPDIGETTTTTSKSPSSSTSTSTSTPSAVTIRWNRETSRSGYSLDVVRDNGELIAPCVNADAIGQATSYRFTGRCVTPNIRVTMGAIRDFRICIAENDDWAHAICTDARWDGHSSSVQINN